MLPFGIPPGEFYLGTVLLVMWGVPFLVSAVGKGKLPSLPPFKRSTAAEPGVIIDPNDAIEQSGFLHLQGYLHALTRSGRATKEQIELVAATGSLLVDLKEPGDALVTVEKKA